MIVSIDWLKEFVNVDDNVEDISEVLSNLGLEAEISSVPLNYPGVKVGYVEKTVKHPNADKLQVCDINDGNSINKVICGAPNVKAGQNIAFATVGTTLPGNFKIKKANIRGINSYGMICSERELNLSDEHEGIMILPENLTVGDDFSSAYGYKFISVAIDITPNRSDAFSYLGVARDIATYKNKPLKKIKVNKRKPYSNRSVQISIEDLTDCPRYIAGVINNIKVKSSPEWIIERLKASGLRSINNIVDISNLVMLEMGHPSHIFDYESLHTNKIHIRRSKNGETFKTLDDKIHNLKKENLLITDGEKPIALAGLMGGANSSISSKTKSVLVECAYFNPITIRKSSKVLGLSTDASKRFERGADPNSCEYAFWRIVNLIEIYASGTLESEMIDNYPEIIEKKIINLDVEEIENVLGVKIPISKIESILIGLEIELKKNKGGYICTVPTFRPDLTRQIDIIEEVARVYGYDSIPIKNSINGNFRFSNPDPEKNYDLLRTYCSGLGFNQIYSNSLQNKTESSRSGINPVKMMNPLNKEMGYLRTELITGLIKASTFNINHGASNFKLFELSNVHEQKGEKLNAIIESKHLAGIIYGKNDNNNIHNINFSEDIYVLKGVLSFLFEKKFITNLEYERDKHSLFNDSYSIIINKKKVGHIGQISVPNMSDIKANLDSLHGFYVNLEPIKGMLNSKKLYKKINLLPQLQRDLNLVLPHNQNIGELVNLISKIGRNLVKSVKPIDIFIDEKALGNQSKSVTFSIIFQHKTKTLKDKDVNPIINEIINVAENEFSAKLRV